VWRGRLVGVAAPPHRWGTVHPDPGQRLRVSPLQVIDQRFPDLAAQIEDGRAVDAGDQHPQPHEATDGIGDLQDPHPAVPDGGRRQGAVQRGPQRSQRHGPVDIEFDRGRFVIAGTDRGIGILELADRLRRGLTLPADVPQSLDVSHISDNPPFSFPNGCHVAEVEIDRDTGTIEVVRYSMVNDFGTVINPMLTAGQAHGGVMQGIGQALMERTVYDPQGQPVAGSYMDYALPRASDAPSFSVENHSVPCKTNLLGVKGCGEAGCAGAMTSVMNAVVDALRDAGISQFDMPASPQRVWQAIQRSRKTA